MERCARCRANAVGILSGLRYRPHKVPVKVERRLDAAALVRCRWKLGLRNVGVGWLRLRGDVFFYIRRQPGVDHGDLKVNLSSDR